MNQQPIADIVSLCVVLAALIFSNEVAAVVGPYLVIVVASAIGASFALRRREKSSRASALLYFVRIAGLAVLLTAALAAVAHSYRPDLNERLLLAPIAILIGWIGDGWPAVFRRVVTLLWGLVDLARGQGGTRP